MGRVSDKVALVTGGSRGLGEAIVRLLAAEGAKVMVADVLDDVGRAVAADIGEAAGYSHLDVRSEEEWLSAIETTESKFGPVSILVNNAGIGNLAPIEACTEAQYRQVIDVNQVGVFLGIRTILASMRKAGGGSIINMSSAAGLVGTRTGMAYVASKFAVRGMTKVAALEYGADNIRVNSIHPGPFLTEMGAPGGKPDATIQPVLDALAVSRMGDPAELAHMALLLASDEMRYASGAEFVIDGGWTCQ